MNINITPDWILCNLPNLIQKVGNNTGCVCCTPENFEINSPWIRLAFATIGLNVSVAFLDKEDEIDFCNEFYLDSKGIVFEKPQHD